MDKDLLKIINHYGVLHQLKYFQTEVFELNEAIIEREYDEYVGDNFKDELKEHITEEIADVMVMLDQFICYYDIDVKDVIDIKHQKINRQLERIKSGNNGNN